MTSVTPLPQDMNDQAPELTTRTLHVREEAGARAYVGRLEGVDGDQGVNALLSFSQKPRAKGEEQVFQVGS